MNSRDYRKGLIEAKNIAIRFQDSMIVEDPNDGVIEADISGIFTIDKLVEIINEEIHRSYQLRDK